MKSSRRSYVLRRVDGVRESETLFLLARSRSAKPTAQRAVPHACAASTSVKKLVCYSTLMTAHLVKTRRKLVVNCTSAA